MLSCDLNSENICMLNTQNLSPPRSLFLSSDEFFVDQLLNLNYDDQHVEDDTFLVTQTPNTNKLSPFHPPSLDFHPSRLDFASLLSVPPPAEEADLEWLSHFVEESFSQFSSPYPDGIVQTAVQPKPEREPEPEPGSPKDASFSSLHAVNKSRRSKRARTGGRVWTTALSSSSSSSSPSSPNPEPARKQRRREAGPGSGRWCTHCGVQKTPQWRRGPLGPKSLCNACGVRYKSGRLLPEYRPACSPTFSSELHSNNHSEVLEMRRKKEVNISGRVGPGLSHPVHSFG